MSLAEGQSSGPYNQERLDVSLGETENRDHKRL